MTTHLRARAAQAGALLAVVAGGIAVAPAVALASPPNVQITNLSTEVVSGSRITVGYTVTDTNVDGGGQNVTAQLRVQGMACADNNCVRIGRVDNDGTDFTAQMTAPTVAAGQTQNVTIQVTATINGESNSTSQQVAVKGPDKPQTVTRISGKVKDQDGKAVSGASVAMKDAAGNPFSTTTNGSGGYSFNSTDAQPIAPGNISIGALKDGYESVTVQTQAAAGRSVTVPLTMKLVAATASASPSASVSAAASTEAADEATEEPSVDAAAADPDTKSASDNSSGSGSLLFIVLGGLLVAAGVGAIVLVMMRRKNSGDDDGPDADDPSILGGGPAMVPPSQGRFNDATRVAAPMGAGRDATMVAPRSGAPSLADAPTMMHRPVEDEFPDPYGAPIPQQGGYRGAAAGGWDDQADGYGGGPQYGGGTYGEPTQYGRPQADDGYGGGNYAAAPSGGYGDQQRRYDEPTGMYRPESEQDEGYGGYDRGGYDQRGGAQYGGGGYQAAGNYQGGAGYDQGGYEEQGGYDSGNGYGPQPGGGAAPAGGAYAGGTYGGAPPQQYGGAYDGGGREAYGGEQGGYDQRGGGTYGRGGAGYGDQAGGYDQAGRGDQAGYDQRGAYGGQPRQQEPSHPGQRRSLDWMDN